MLVVFLKYKDVNERTKKIYMFENWKIKKQGVCIDIKKTKIK